MDWMRDVIDDALRGTDREIRKYLGRINSVDIDISLAEDADVVVEGNIVKVAFEWEYPNVSVYLVDSALIAKYIENSTYIARVLFLPFKAKLIKWYLKNGIIYAELLLI